MNSKLLGRIGAVGMLCAVGAMAPTQVFASNNAVTSISAACNSGNSAFEGLVRTTDNYTGTVHLFLTYHVPGASDWTPTGDTTDAVFTGGDSASYSMPITSFVNANSYRVEISGSDPTLEGLT